MTNERLRREFDAAVTLVCRQWDAMPRTSQLRAIIALTPTMVTHLRTDDFDRSLAEVIAELRELWRVPDVATGGEEVDHDEA